MNLTITKDKKKVAKKDNKYLVLLIDRKEAKIFMVHSSGAVERTEEFVDGNVPQKVKHGDDARAAEDKIFRHIEDHLHKHLTLIAEKVKLYAAQEDIAGILIGGHNQLFTKIKKHLPYPLSGQVKGTFLVDMKVPFNEILKRIKVLIEEIEK
jgi:peptide subunit release factor 1 (eRF1)